MIEVALNEAAEKAGVTRGTLDEMSVPTYDLDANGKCEIAVGAGAALIEIDGTASVALTWRMADGKVTKSLPEPLKGLKDEVKAIKARVKEIEADLGVQPWRVQRIWLDDRRWFVDNPVEGCSARRGRQDHRPDNPEPDCALSASLRPGVRRLTGTISIPPIPDVRDRSISSADRARSDVSYWDRAPSATDNSVTDNTVANGRNGSITSVLQLA